MVSVKLSLSIPENISGLKILLLHIFSHSAHEHNLLGQHGRKEEEKGKDTPKASNQETRALAHGVRRSMSNRQAA